MASPSRPLALVTLWLASCTTFSGAEVDAVTGAGGTVSGGSGQTGGAAQPGGAGQAGGVDPTVGPGGGGVSGEAGQGGAGSAGSAGGQGGAGQGGSSAVCGDGRREGDEACDGGDLGGQSCAGLLGASTTGTLACATSCQFDAAGCVRCGDGVRQGSESCDGADLGGMTCATALGDMGSMGPLSCTAQCLLDTSPCHRCGNGKQEPGEECDDGNQSDGDACANDCTRTFCGDGIVQASEECDAGTSHNGDTFPCSADCRLNCQNNGEHLDVTSGHCYRDAGTSLGWYDARAACQQLGPGFDLATLTSPEELTFVASFGPPDRWLGATNHTVSGAFAWVTGEPWTYLAQQSPWAPGEPTNSQGYEHCVSLHVEGQKPSIGDWNCYSVTRIPLCERGPLSDPQCRDGKLAGVEQCDDGNTTDNDTCTNSCRLFQCGDGKVEPGEECDDGNQDDTDACTSLCRQADCHDGFLQPSIGELCDDPGPHCSYGCKPM